MGWEEMGRDETGMRWNEMEQAKRSRSGSRQVGRGLGNMVVVTVEVGDLSQGVGFGNVKIQP